MNGCKFLREKGEDLEWNHAELFPYFKSKIEPFMSGVEDTCGAMLDFFHSIRNYEIKLTASIERHYEIFIDMYHYQQFIDLEEAIMPSIEVQLMWISHCLNPVEYYRDCQAKYKKILDVNIIAIPNDFHPLLEPHPSLDTSLRNGFEHYLNRKLNTNVFAPISTSLKTLTTTTSLTTKESQQSWFIHNLHMKNSMIQQVEFIRKVNFVQLYNRINRHDIQKAIHRYYKFLYVMALPSNKRPPICIPTLDIDLIWHSHILNFKDYHAMSRYLFPQIEIIPHNHSMHPTQQNRNKQLTQIFWDKMFGDADYLNGRTFYILYHKKETMMTQRKRVNRKQTPRRPHPPVVLEEEQEPINAMTPVPSMECMPSHSHTPLPCVKERSITITRVHSAEPADASHETCTTTKALVVEDTNSVDKLQKIGSLDSEISTEMLMKGEHETNCCSLCELCTDCCQWSFKSYQQESVYIICTCVICVVFVLCLLALFVFIPAVSDGFTVDLYQNRVAINADASITVDSVMVYEWKGALNHNNKALDWYKSIAYDIDGIEEDVVRFNGNALVSAPYVKDSYYYVDMNMNSVSDKTKAFIRFNYTLSPSYLCCNNEACDEIGLLMPWINQWPYQSRVEQFNMNIFYENMTALVSAYSDWAGEALDGVYSVSTNKMDRERNLNVYFRLLDNDTRFVNSSDAMKPCSEQLKYFMDEDVTYETVDGEVTIMSVNEFVLISISTVLFVICACFGCWWIMYLYDNSFCCDLCAVVVAK